MSFSNQQKPMIATTIDDLSEDIWVEILCKLPANYMLRCKSVSKAWRSLVCDVCIPRMIPSSCPVHRAILCSTRKSWISWEILEWECRYSADIYTSDSFSLKPCTSDSIKQVQSGISSTREFVDYCNGLFLFYSPLLKSHIGVIARKRFYKEYAHIVEINFREPMTAKEKNLVDRKLKLRSIPLDMVIEILSWLPFKTLQRFKCVCKLWLSLLTNDSYFGKLHCKRVMECDYGIRHIDSWMKGATFSQAVYECFYGNHRVYSIRNLILRLSASGFVQRQWPFYADIICNGLYRITYKGSAWFERLWPSCGSSSTLVLAPTTKVVQEIAFARYGTHVCVDGNSVLESQLLLSSGKKVVVGTPGCVYEIISRHSISSDCIKEFVLYNAGELFARGYKDKIYDIFKILPRKVKVVLISNCMPREAFEIPQQFWNQKEGQWNTDTLLEAPGKTMTSSRSLWAQQSIEVKHNKELIASKAMKKSGKQRTKMSKYRDPH